MFLGKLTPVERLLVGNLTQDVYESVIREKTPGIPNLVLATPSSDAFWQLQEQLAVLRKLEIGDIRRLKESASLAMGADLVARGLGLIVLLGSWLYFTILESSAKGATPGKMLFRLRVTGLDGARISFSRATGRFFAKGLGVLTFSFGFLMAGFNAKKQALHDLVARTLVMRKTD